MSRLFLFSKTCEISVSKKIMQYYMVSVWLILVVSFLIFE